jgi:hypothetical protein
MRRTSFRESHWLALALAAHVQLVLRQQVRSHTSITDVNAGDADGPNLQGIRIDAYVPLAPLAAVVSRMRFALPLSLPLAFLRELDAC